MKEALKFSMGFNERLITTVGTKIKSYDEKDKMVNAQAIIIEELTVELEETKKAADQQREEYESQLMSQRTYRGNNPAAENPFGAS